MTINLGPQRPYTCRKSDVMEEGGGVNLEVVKGLYADILKAHMWMRVKKRK